MQESILSSLIDHSFKHDYPSKSLMQTLADKNTESFAEVPKGVNLPTAEGLETISAWISRYKKNNPSFSRRKIRKDVQAHFNIRIFRKPYKRELHG